MKVVKPLILIGTRPEAIKLAPVIAECQRRGALLDVQVCLTGQHRGLLKPFIEYFDIPVHHDLKVIRARQALSDLTARMLTRITAVLEASEPDCVLGQGDTTTVMAGALARGAALEREGVQVSEDAQLDEEQREQRYDELIAAGRSANAAARAFGVLAGVGCVAGVGLLVSGALLRARGSGRLRTSAGGVEVRF